MVAMTACGGEAPASVEATDAAAMTITEAEVYGRVALLAADSMRGRDTPSPELDQAADWIASEFRSMGLEPAFGQDYLQTYSIRRIAPDMVASTASLDGAPLRFGDDLALSFGPAEGRYEGTLTVMSGSADWERAVTRTAVADRHVVWIRGPGENGIRSADARRISRAIRVNGAASLLIASDVDDRVWFRDLDLRSQQTSLVLEGEGGGMPTLAVRDRALQEALGLDVSALRGRASEDVEFSERSQRLHLDLAVSVIEESRAPNVAAVLRGSDERLRDEYVVYSAHMDHVGVGAPDEQGDSIWNGADDDASGTATVMEVAQAFSTLEPAPRRSFIFLLVSGEEKGLWGARAFGARPPVPIERMVANLNADMVGRNWPDTIVAIGREHSDLGETLETVNRAHPELGMTAIDDLWPEENFYSRSDHFIFARSGVPILFFFNGTHEDYHRPSDEVDKIDAEKAARIGRLLFYLGAEVANRDRPPQWNPESYERIVQPG